MELRLAEKVFWRHAQKEKARKKWGRSSREVTHFHRERFLRRSDGGEGFQLQMRGATWNRGNEPGGACFRGEAQSRAAGKERKSRVVVPSKTLCRQNHVKISAD